MSPRAPWIRLLGPITILQRSGAAVAPARLDRVVLAHLVLAEGRIVSTGDLIDAIWGPEPPARARNALQVKVSRLRRHLELDQSGLEHRQGGYRLAVGADAIDIGRFGDLARAAAGSLARGELAAAQQAAHDALSLWQGPPLADLDEHPRLVAARARLQEQRAMVLEILAEARLGAGEDVRQEVALLRGLLAEEPLRTRARLLLMRALDHSGRRAEALSVYDAGRRTLAEQTGLTPPAELQQEFERLMAEERHSARREAGRTHVTTVPDGAMETARWLARQGSTSAAFELALRGSWWWWLGGRRSEGRELLAELIGRTEPGGPADRSVTGASAWLAVFDSVGADAEALIAQGEAALLTGTHLGWDDHASLAALLLAERLYQRGVPRRAGALLQLSRAHFDAGDNAWGRALTVLVAAKGDLQRGFVIRALSGGRAAYAAFEELGDAAGQMMALDLIGYCAEVMGDLDEAARTHQWALALARSVDAPEWEATQLIRLGSIQALLGLRRSLVTLRASTAFARSIGSGAGSALAENAIGLAHGLLGDREAAAEAHTSALDWYEQQASQAGVSYTVGRLACALGAQAADVAADLAGRSVALARQTGDPRAIAHGLESIVMAHPDSLVRARALGEAAALRHRTRSPLPAPLADALDSVTEVLDRDLGHELHAQLREGALQAERALAG